MLGYIDDLDFLLHPFIDLKSTEVHDRGAACEVDAARHLSCVSVDRFEKHFLAHGSVIILARISKIQVRVLIDVIIII